MRSGIPDYHPDGKLWESQMVRWLKDGSIIVANSEGRGTMTIGDRIVEGEGVFVVAIRDGTANVSHRGEGVNVTLR